MCVGEGGHVHVHVHMCAFIHVHLCVWLEQLGVVVGSVPPGLFLLLSSFLELSILICMYMYMYVQSVLAV